MQKYVHDYVYPNLQFTPYCVSVDRQNCRIMENLLEFDLKISVIFASGGANLIVPEAHVPNTHDLLPVQVHILWQY